MMLIRRVVFVILYNKVYAARLCKHKCKGRKKNRTHAHYLHIIKKF